MAETQRRPTLDQTTQQFAATPAAAIKAAKIASFTADGTLGAEYDLALVNANAGAVTLDLPGANQVYIGLRYTVKEIGVVNGVTVQPAGGSGTIDGGPNFAIVAGASASFVAASVDKNAGTTVWYEIT
jgi:hypothetical protein